MQWSGSAFLGPLFLWLNCGGERENQSGEFYTEFTEHTESAEKRTRQSRRRRGVWNDVS